MICSNCAAAADWDVRRLAWNAAHHGREMRERRTTDPQHCEDPTCTCRHRPVQPRKEET